MRNQKKERATTFSKITAMLCGLCFGLMALIIYGVCFLTADDENKLKWQDRICFCFAGMLLLILFLVIFV